MKDEIARRFELNLQRVKSLVTAYENAPAGAGGQPSVATTDLLRAAVVFLHASLEDVLRSLLEWKLPSAKPEHLEKVPLDGEEFRRYTLADVAKHRGRSVDELIERSVKASLERSNYNSVEDVATALTRSSLDTKVIDPHGADLESMMKRRHWIVHRADRNEAKGTGHAPVRPLQPDAVKAWLASVETFGKAVLALL